MPIPPFFSLREPRVPKRRHKAPRIIAVANQKGGVGKTTTAINLGASLAKAGAHTLLIDLDPQGNASTGLGFTPKDRALSVHEVMSKKTNLQEAIQKSPLDNLYLLPSSEQLSSADIALVNEERRLFFLADALSDTEVNRINVSYILIDCPPSLNILTLNAMVASSSILAPLQAEFFALEGLAQLIGSMRQVRSVANPLLHLEGVLLTMIDRRNNLSRQVERDARQNLQQLVFDTVIPRTVKLSEAPSHGLPALLYAQNSKGSVAYKNLAEEMLGRNTQNGGR